ncbi:hypothetical protein BDZ45DRAFT_269936 [Acephala macrosclerotiorum]|nr:hypothetical protein BDZ45DRAFT_269936 [Acephala macrosclerotiorum]
MTKQNMLMRYPSSQSQGRGVNSGFLDFPLAQCTGRSGTSRFLCIQLLDLSIENPPDVVPNLFPSKVRHRPPSPTKRRSPSLANRHPHSQQSHHLNIRKHLYSTRRHRNNRLQQPHHQSRPINTHRHLWQTQLKGRHADDLLSYYVSKGY